MRERRIAVGAAVIGLAAPVAATPPVDTGGFELSTRSSKGVAMKGAFVAAVSMSQSTATG